MKYMFLLPTFLLLSCAHDHLAAVDVNSTSGDLIVNIGSKEVKVGDEISAYRIVCANFDQPRRGRTSDCRHKEVGVARVIEVLGPDSARVRGSGGLIATEEMHFEKKN